MKLSQYFLSTLREKPSDADTISSQLMIRAGLIRKLAGGIYEWLPLGLRILKKVEQIVREEMNKIGGQEISLPLLLPKELWEETGRWQLYGKELFRLKDRKDAEFCLGPTHEEIITDIVRKEVRSYRQLPLMLYQFGTKFRDEIRPRYGVMRAREFYMKDAYSFHATEQDAEKYYDKVIKAYSTICERCGFKYRIVEALTGAIGGKFSHEFMVLTPEQGGGEEEIVWCDCGYSANVEKAECVKENSMFNVKDSELKKLEEVYTPNMKTVEEVGKFLGAPAEKFIKSLIYLSDGKPIMVLIRGDYEVNENKLKENLICTELALADAETIKKLTSAEVGFAGPVFYSSIYEPPFPIIADYSVENVVNAISGANKTNYHMKNININRDYRPHKIIDLRRVKKGDICPRCKQKELNFCYGIEIGHTFKLGTKYSKYMNATFLDATGKEQYFIMGCYGIGISRIVAAAIEQSHDENGIIWHKNLSPYQVIIIPIDYSDELIRDVSEKIYNELCEKKYETIIDDRQERAGVKFIDADLIGIPVRITVSRRHLPDKVELKLRSSKDVQICPINNISKFLAEWIGS